MASVAPVRPLAPPFEVVLATEASLRAAYLHIDESLRAEPDGGQRALGILQQSAVFLELVLVAAITFEVVDELALDASDPSGWPAEALSERIRLQTGLDPASVVSEAVHLLQLKLPTRSENHRISRDAVLRSVRSILESCPIAALEVLASKHELESLSHRARRAYDGLHAFLFRTDPGLQEQVRILGRTYSEGHLSLEEAGKLLGIHPVDAVALLEQGAFRRPLDVIALSDRDRSEVYSRMRLDRLARKGSFTPSAEMVSRDAVASERIEGVDARGWIPREGS